MRVNSWLIALASVAGVALAATTAFGQTSTGEIAGSLSVRDGWRSELPGVRVTTADGSGRFVVGRRLRWARVGASGASEVRPAQLGRSVAATRVVSSGASATVLSTLVSRGERLVVLVLWRGAPGWLGRGGRASTQGGGSERQTWAQLTRGDVTVDLDIDHATGLARLRGQPIRLGDNNVILVDGVDTKASVVRMLRVDPTVPDTPDAPFVVLRRDPALIEFLQCELTQADPVLGRLLATHPCGRR